MVRTGHNVTQKGCFGSWLSRHRQVVTVSAVGGSVTAGSTTSTHGGRDVLYHSRVVRALQVLLPANDGPHGHTNAGVSQTGPCYHELCLPRHLPSSPDLVLVDAAVNLNDDRKGVAAFERLLRRLLRHPARPALLVVNNHNWNPSAHSAANAKVHEDGIEELCDHYRVSAVSMRRALADSVRTGARNTSTFVKPDGGRHLNDEGRLARILSGGPCLFCLI